MQVRYCSPTNKASQLSPQAFASYLREPWCEIVTSRARTRRTQARARGPQAHRTVRAVRARRYEILTEWNEFQFEGEAAGEEEEADELDEDVEAALAERWEQLRTSNAEIDVLVRVEPDDDWTIVNWRLSRHNGRWLTDALSIN